MASAETTAAELVERGLRPERAKHRLRNALLKALEDRSEGRRADRPGVVLDLFEDVVLETETAEVLTTSLLAGSNVLVLGPPGSGKTSLAKAIWDHFPKDLFAVADCPVHDDPFSLVDPAFARRVPPCPYCRANHGGVDPDELGRFDPSEVDPEDVPVRKIRLREGYGFARVQGSPEVFPDNLTGSVNLARLEEIGDPTSPLVLEPGKVLQAHRGLLLVDELGKLPRGTQNVLLQALQESIVSPAKSRETFPADLVAIATSNFEDLGNITEPLNDRLTNVLVQLPVDPAKNRRIIDLGLAETDGLFPLAGPYRDAAVRVVVRWRERVDAGREFSEVGSNRTLIDIAERTRAYAMMAGDPRIDLDDLRRGIHDALVGRIRARSADGFAENRDLVDRFVDDHWREAARDGAVDWWCRFFETELDGDEAEGRRTVEALRELAAEAHEDAATVHEKLRSEQAGDEVLRVARYVERAEGVDREQAAELVPAIVDALEDLGAFEEAP